MLFASSGGFYIIGISLEFALPKPEEPSAHSIK